MPSRSIWRTTTDEEPAKPATAAHAPRCDPPRGCIAGAWHDADRFRGSAGRIPFVGVRTAARAASLVTGNGGAHRETPAHYAGELATYAGGDRSLGDRATPG